LCLLCAALPALAEKPDDNKGTLINDNRSRANSQQMQSERTDVGGKSLEQWRKDLRDPDPSVRAAALMAISQFGQAAAKAIPDVVDRLRDPDASPRVKAALVLRMIPHYDTDRARVIRGLGHAISHDNQTIIRYEAAVSLKYFCPLTGKDEREAVQDLVASLNSTSTFELRDACIETLIYAGVDPKTGPDQRVTKALITRANFQWEPTTQVRLKAIMALGAMGRPQHPNDYRDVMDILKSKYNYQSKHPTVKIWSHVAIIALDEKADKKDLETIADYLKNREAAVRVQAVTALGALEDKAQNYVTNICDMLQREKDNSVKAAAALSLGRMKNTGQRVLSELISMSEEDDDESVGVVLNACTALSQLGANTPEVMKALNKVLEHKSLKRFQKDLIVQKAIDDITHPKQKPVKQPAKNPDKGIGGKR
jgi:HEAT repeat protein